LHDSGQGVVIVCFSQPVGGESKTHWISGRKLEARQASAQAKRINPSIDTPYMG
jgi:hypothetical protein